MTHLLLISGSVRSGSGNAAVLRTVQAMYPTSVLYEGIGGLPHFNPDDDRDPLPPAVFDLRAAIAASSGLLFCTPEYAGALPGSFKNLLDWTIGGGEIYRKPVAWFNISTSGTGAAGAQDELRRVLGYAGTSIAETACRHVPVARDLVGSDGLIADAAIRAEIAAAITALTEHVPSD